MSEESIFKAQYIVTFLATWAAANLAESRGAIACEVPAEDAAVMAEAAWRECVKYDVFEAEVGR